MDSHKQPQASHRSYSQGSLLDSPKIARSRSELSRAKTVLSERGVPEGTSREEKLFVAEVSRSGDGGVLGKSSIGYTIVEVMIFLAISSAILVSALLLVGGQQQKTQFTQSLRDIDSHIRDVMNDVSAGIYSNTGNFQCLADNAGSAPVISAGADKQGANVSCIYIGKVLQFGPASSPEDFNVFSVAGRQFRGAPIASKLVSDITESKPVPIAPNIAHLAMIGPGLDATDYNKLDYGLTIKDNSDGAHPGLSYDNGSGPQAIGAFGFFSNFVTYPDGSASPESGRQFTDIWVIPASAYGDDARNVADDIIDIGGLSSSAATSFKNPAKGITLCFLSSGTSQYGKITIGDNNQRLATTLSVGYRGDGSICT